jgi:AcrR family transcriptional regulator
MPRTPSASAHQKVLDATLKLVADHGMDATSMDAIAHQSGVSKATIYKHWADKDALLLEVLAQMSGIRSRPAFDSGDTRADMIAVLAYKPEENAELRERIMPHLVAYSARNLKFGNTWRHMVMEPPREELRHLLRQGIKQGELDSGMDMELALALLLGPMVYAYVFLCRPADSKWSSGPGRAERSQFAEGVVDTFWRAFGLPRGPGRRARRS